MTVCCDYCGKKAKKITGKTLYPRHEYLWGKTYFRCEPCDAHVGTHDGTGEPLGTLADRKLRSARMDAHEAFDQMWRERVVHRSFAYRWLRKRMGLTRTAHGGGMTFEECQFVINLDEEITEKLKATREIWETWAALGGDNG